MTSRKGPLSTLRARRRYYGETDMEKPQKTKYASWSTSSSTWVLFSLSRPSHHTIRLLGLRVQTPRRMLNFYFVSGWYLEHCWAKSLFFPFLAWDIKIWTKEVPKLRCLLQLVPPNFVFLPPLCSFSSTSRRSCESFFRDNFCFRDAPRWSLKNSFLPITKSWFSKIRFAFWKDSSPLSPDAISNALACPTLRSRCTEYRKGSGFIGWWCSRCVYPIA